MFALKINNMVFPSVINNKEYDNSYVCSIYNALISYSAEESRKLNNPIFEFILRILISAHSKLFKWAAIDSNLYVNNYLLSTNLYPNWSGEGLDQFTKKSTIQFKNHAIIFRSLNHHTNHALLKKLTKTGYQLIPTRQVYILDKHLKHYACSRDLKKDRQLRNNSTYSLVQHQDITALDYPRIVELYNLLYLKKYSYHNPHYNEAMIKHWHEHNLLDITGLRNSQGILDGVIGIFQNDTTLSAPLVGYNTNLPQEHGLYRQLISLLIDCSLMCNKNVNLSSGAPQFKLNRGATAFTEYAAVYTKHLPFYRRSTWSYIKLLLSQVVIRILKAYKL